MTDYPSYNDYLATWDDNDKKAAEYIKTTNHQLIRSFYNELDYTKGELPKSVTTTATHSNETSKIKLYPKHSPLIIEVCKEVEEFIKSKGFPYKLCQYESGFNHSGIWPIRCVFDLKK
jgi:hypothetical protein